MESSKEHFEKQQPVMGGFSDVKRVKQSGAASVAELREFLGKLKGRSPQEVMGIVAQSSLVKGITTATIGCVVLLLAFTVLPYLWYGGPASAGTPDTATASVAVAAPATDTDTAPPEVTPETNATADTPGEADLARAAKAMGIDKTSEADPDKNPLDTKLDSLLDGIE